MAWFTCLLPRLPQTDARSAMKAAKAKYEFLGQDLIRVKTLDPYGKQADKRKKEAVDYVSRVSGWGQWVGGASGWASGWASWWGSGRGSGTVGGGGAVGGAGGGAVGGAVGGAMGGAGGGATVLIISLMILYQCMCLPNHSLIVATVLIILMLDPT